MSERALAAVVYSLSLLVCAAVLILVLVPDLVTVEGMDVSILPRFHATLNGSTAGLLLLGWVMIRGRRIASHRLAMASAFALSCVFLVSYLVYHSQAPDTAYGGEGWIRPVYFFVLVSHIVLAPVILPLALYTLARALRNELPLHRRVARWTLPIWLYVAVTGVIVYLMMAPYYPA